MEKEQSGGVVAPTPPPDLIQLVEPPADPATTAPEKATTRKWLAFLITFLVMGAFLFVGIRYLYCNNPADRDDFIHLIELLLVVYGTILGFYFGSTD